MKHTVESMTQTIRLIISDVNISHEETYKQIERYLKEVERDNKNEEK